MLGNNGYCTLLVGMGIAMNFSENYLTRCIKIFNGNHKRKNNRLDFVKTVSAFHKKLLEFFFLSHRGKVFANHISNKELIAQNIYKLSKINSKKTKLINIF